MTKDTPPCSRPPAPRRCCRSDKTGRPHPDDAPVGDGARVRPRREVKNAERAQTVSPGGAKAPAYVSSEGLWVGPRRVGSLESGRAALITLIPE